MKKFITKISIITTICCAFAFSAQAKIDTVQVAPGSADVFSPSSFNLCLGDTIRFVWASSTSHIVHILTPIDSVYPVYSTTGDMVEFKPTAAGAYTYQCDIHYMFGMTGTFTVNNAPTVNLGSDITVCGSTILNAGNPGATYAWSTTELPKT